MQFIVDFTITRREKYISSNEEDINNREIEIVTEHDEDEQGQKNNNRRKSK